VERAAEDEEFGGVKMGKGELFGLPQPTTVTWWVQC
jgi:hypothetical protein